MDFPINSMVIFHCKMLVHQRVMCFFCWRFQRFPTVCPRARNSERGLQAGQVNNTKIPKFKYLWWGTHMSSKFAREIKSLKNIFKKNIPKHIKIKTSSILCNHICVTLWWTYKKQLKMAIEIMDFPIKNGGSFHSFLYVHQRVMKSSFQNHGTHHGNGPPHPRWPASAGVFSPPRRWPPVLPFGRPSPRARRGCWTSKSCGQRRAGWGWGVGHGWHADEEICYDFFVWIDDDDDV